jgi:hypothetical protein
MNYKLNEVDLSKEIFDNEAVIINIPSGRYYSVNGETGVSVIRLLENAANKDQVGEYLVTKYDCINVDLKTQVDTFIDSLFAEKIILEVTENEFSQPEHSAILKPFNTLFLEIYDDMQELIELDPIHDVKATKGWPNKK